MRCGTIVAAGCFSPSVNHQDMEWALKWSRVSFNAATGGFETYLKDYFEFPKFCEEVVQAIHFAGGFMPNRDLERRFRKHMKRGDELDKVFRQLQKEDRIKKDTRRTGERGPAATGWMTIEEE
jgi:hypothetical protein